MFIKCLTILSSIDILDITPFMFTSCSGRQLICARQYLSRRAFTTAKVFIKGPIISGTTNHPIKFDQRNMKLITDQGNYSLLKIYAAANIAKREIKVDLVQPNSKEFHDKKSVHQGQLPYLELSNGKLLFGSNTICQYLIEEEKKGQPGDAEKQKVKEIVDWDTSIVQACAIPYLAAACNGDEPQPIILESLEKCLCELDELVKVGGNAVGVALTLADVALWGTLFVAFLEGHALEGVKEKYPAAYKWFHSLSSKDEFRAAQLKVIHGNDVAVFKKSINHATLAHNRVTGPSEGGDLTEEAPSANEVLKAKEAWLKGRGVIPTKQERHHPVLPLPNERNILITSALPYVNNVPHLGNIIGCVLSGDVYARYCRLRGHNCLYICGTDEYGTATETKALEEGLTPQQICDKYNKVHEDVYRWFNIEFDFFGRTTTKQQTEIAQDIFWKLEENGYLSKGSIAQLFCEKCQRFLADRFVEGICPQCSKDGARGDQCDSCGKLINAVDLKSPRCKVCEAQPVVKSSDHIFLDLPKIEPELKEWVGKAHEEGQWTHNAIGITKGWLQEGLLPRCITRDLKWGTPVPMEGYTDKVFYVWFDAPIGYLSITANYTDQWEKWWKNPDEVTLVQFMAKDNVPFHTVVFPCSLIGAKDNYTLLNDISATEYLNYEDDKFSKSRGIGVFGDNAADTGIPADVYRFYLLAVRPESQDSVFSWDDFVARNNTELLNNLGNFINRALSFLSNNFQGLIPPMQLTNSDFDYLSLINREIVAYIGNLEKIKLREGLRNILNISRLGNQYLQSTKPWALVKGTEAEKDRAGSVIALSCNICALLGQLLSPYMPKVSEEIRNQLQYPAELDVIPDILVPVLPEKHKIGSPKPLFKKIEPLIAKQLKERFSGGQAK